MNIQLRKWILSDKESLKALCNAVDRQYLSDRLPSPTPIPMRNGG